MQDSKECIMSAKRDFTAILVQMIYPPIYQGIYSIWEDSKRAADPKKVHTEFQHRLSRVPKWNQSVIDREYERIIKHSKCDYLDELIKRVFLINTQVLAITIDPTRKIKISIPKTDHFFHKIYEECARNFFENSILMEDRQGSIPRFEQAKNLPRAQKLIVTSIENTIRKLLPIESLVRGTSDEMEGEEVPPSLLFQNIQDFENERRKEHKNNVENHEYTNYNERKNIYEDGNSDRNYDRNNYENQNSDINGREIDLNFSKNSYPEVPKNPVFSKTSLFPTLSAVLREADGYPPIAPPLKNSEKDEYEKYEDENRRDENRRDEKNEKDIKRKIEVLNEKPYNYDFDPTLLNTIESDSKKEDKKLHDIDFYDDSQNERNEKDFDYREKEKDDYERKYDNENENERENYERQKRREERKSRRNSDRGESKEESKLIYLHDRSNDRPKNMKDSDLNSDVSDSYRQKQDDLQNDNEVPNVRRKRPSEKIDLDVFSANEEFPVSDLFKTEESTDVNKSNKTIESENKVPSLDNFDADNFFSDSD